MGKKILIIGQGISGTMLSWYLKKAQIDFKIIDNNAENTASKVAAGIINPVTGRRIVKTWMIDELMPFAVAAYQQIAAELHIDLVTELPIADIFPTQQMKAAFAERIIENADYLQLDQSIKITDITHHYGVGYIKPAYIIAVQKLITEWRSFLEKENKISSITFNENDLIINDNHIEYHNEHYAHIIYANGVQTTDSKFWNKLPFAPNKGEALIIECAQLPQTYIYKKGLTIAPISNNQFWVGANYIWNYEDEKPTHLFLKQTEQQLKEILKVPFTILNHKSAIRPANIERRPFVGFHPVHNCIGILGGMGAKGTSLAPFFAAALVNNIENNFPILAEANVLRFQRILSLK